MSLEKKTNKLPISEKAVQAIAALASLHYKGADAVLESDLLKDDPLLGRIILEEISANDAYSSRGSALIDIINELLNEVTARSEWEWERVFHTRLHDDSRAKFKFRAAANAIAQSMNLPADSVEYAPAGEESEKSLQHVWETGLSAIIQRDSYITLIEDYLHDKIHTYLENQGLDNCDSTGDVGLNHEIIEGFTDIFLRQAVKPPRFQQDEYLPVSVQFGLRGATKAYGEYVLNDKSIELSREELNDFQVSLHLSVLAAIIERQRDNHLSVIDQPMRPVRKWLEQVPDSSP